MTEQTHGGQREGAGRPRAFKDAIRRSVTMEREHAAFLEQRYGTVSAGVRDLASHALAEHKSDLRYQRRQKRNP